MTRGLYLLFFPLVVKEVGVGEDVDAKYYHVGRVIID